jgi:hypothetical protein
VFVAVLDVDAVDAVSQSFESNVYYEARWRDERLAHDAPGEQIRALDTVWNPRLQLLNQQRVIQTLPRIVEVTPEGDVSYRQRVWGPFSQPMAVKDFPFDAQHFELVLIAAGFGSEEVRLVGDPARPSGLAPSLSVADWSFRHSSFEARDLAVAPETDPVPAFVLVLEADRRSAYFVLKVIVPLLLIVAMSWTVFWLNPEQASTQIAVATTSMLTLIAYRFAVGSYIPKVPYLTRLDLFILASTLLVFAALVAAVFTAYLANAGKALQANRLERWLRFLFPSASLVICAVSFLV